VAVAAGAKRASSDARDAAGLRPLGWRPPAHLRIAPRRRRVDLVSIKNAVGALAAANQEPVPPPPATERAAASTAVLGEERRHGFRIPDAVTASSSPTSRNEP